MLARRTSPEISRWAEIYGPIGVHINNATVLMFSPRVVVVGVSAFGVGAFVRTYVRSLVVDQRGLPFSPSVPQKTILYYFQVSCPHKKGFQL